jgi:hypothetical protein
MNIVLTCINNYQSYILANIKQLIKLEHKNIYVITNKQFFSNFENYDVKLINIDELPDSYNFKRRTRLDRRFRNGFMMLCSFRFFLIYAFMKKYNIDNVIHLENDVTIYYNCDILLDILGKSNRMYIPFDSFTRNIASIIYIPNHALFKNILDRYNLVQNDMYNFRNILVKTNYIDTFPIFISNNENNEIQFVSRNYTLFNYIFDAAAIGQYLGGTDPIHNNGIGFVNETCVIKYNKYEFIWEMVDGIRKPFMRINNTSIPIFNLHIHCKDLDRFT